MEIKITCKEGEVNVNVMLTEALNDGAPSEVLSNVTRSVFLPEFELQADQQCVTASMFFLEHAEQLTAGRGAAGHGTARMVAGGASSRSASMAPRRRS
jgi:hypothetical protein